MASGPTLISVCNEPSVPSHTHLAYSILGFHLHTDLWRLRHRLVSSQGGGGGWFPGFSSIDRNPLFGPGSGSGIGYMVLQPAGWACEVLTHQQSVQECPRVTEPPKGRGVAHPDGG